MYFIDMFKCIFKAVFQTSGCFSASPQCLFIYLGNLVNIFHFSNNHCKNSSSFLRVR